jgi:Protein of unknown function (DUF3617)
MKMRVCLVIAMLAAPVAMVAQGPTAPPMKMGLWQSTSTMTMTGMQIPPEVAARMQAMGRPVPGGPRTVVTQSCLTPEKWQKTFGDMQQRQGQECHLSNQQVSSAGMSADIACKSQEGRGSSTGRIEVTFTSAEKTNGKVHMETTIESQPKPIVSDVTFESVYQGADCKGISPDSPKVMH